MILIKRLYSKPKIFEEIPFTTGVNIILGEKVASEQVESKKDKKTNGVGKSLCVEFINFCLLKQGSSSRVLRIPKDKIPDEVSAFIDIEFFGRNLTIERSLIKPDTPKIVDNGIEHNFESVDDALLYLNNIIENEYSETEMQIPSFRQMLGPLIREEESEFRDIAKCYSLIGRNIDMPVLSKPHLFLFNVNPEYVDRVKDITKRYEEVRIYKGQLEDLLTLNGKRKLSDVRSDINQLQKEVENISDAISELKTNPAYEIIQKDLEDLERSIDSLRVKQGALHYEIGNIKALPTYEEINTEEIANLYEIFKAGLGEHIKQSLEDVLQFKKNIDNYQQKLLNIRLKDLQLNYKNNAEELTKLEETRNKKIKALDMKGTLKDIKNSIHLQQSKHQELIALKSNSEQHKEADSEMQKRKIERDNELLELQQAIRDSSNITDSFNETITEINEALMGFGKPSFEIKVKTNLSAKRNFLYLDMRIQDDGGHSGNRTKVFIYDLGLMQNIETNKHHLRLLIHDNILEVDQNTLVESLNYLNEMELKASESFQYILTLNRDKIESEERNDEIVLDIEGHTIARFTKQNKFLKRDYQEI